MKANAVLELQNIHKTFPGVKALQNVDFTLCEGEIHALMGTNGAGKSTTINILSTILKKTSGEVKVFDNVLGEDDDNIRSLIGIVFQNSVLDDKLTVKENLYTRGAYYGLTKKQTDERLSEFREGFELDEIWNRRYDKLSGGQRRRVDIARALIHNPRILFLDEPTTGLDPKSRKIVWDHIDYLRREKKMTIFLTTHYMEETKDADHVVILDKGEIIAQGTPAELKTGYASSRLVWYAQESDENAEILKGMDFTYDSDHYNVKFRESITDLLYEYKNKITDFEIIKGSMDDVFLNLTGREIANV